MRRAFVVLLVAGLWLALLPVSGMAAGASPANGREEVYIVVLSSGHPRDVAADHAGRHGAEVTRVYEHALRGYAARMAPSAADRISRDPRVAFVEPDGPVTALGIQEGATWGLDRIDQRQLPLDSLYHTETDAAGVTVYVIDTGIRASHEDFGGRVGAGFSAIDDAHGTDDCNGHGTHVAGTAGGQTWGVAKAVTLVPVRVLDCDGYGTWSGVIAGVDWVTANASGPAVANMSLGGGASDAVDSAIRNSTAAGITYAVAAGNSGADACWYSPARVAEALTVAATDSADRRATWSNRGPCVDLFAPGVSITSASHTSDTASRTASGTSMASPHVAGVAALYLAHDPTASAAAVHDAVTANATSGVVGRLSGSPDRLVYSLFGLESPEPEPSRDAPTVTIDSPADGASFPEGTEITFSGTAVDADGVDLSGELSWTAGDTALGIGASITVTLDPGQHTVTAAVTDSEGLTGSDSISVTVEAAAEDLFGLTVSVSKVRGWNSADLSWSDTGASAYDVYRDGVVVSTVGTTTHTDDIGRGGGTVSYQVCEAGSSTCSAVVTVSY